VTQHLLKAALAGAKTNDYSLANLQSLARYCTQQEDAANKVERQVKKCAAESGSRSATPCASG